MRHFMPATAAAALILLLPATASAARVIPDGDTIIVRGASAADDIGVTVTRGGRLTISGVALRGAGPCVARSGRAAVSCAMPMRLQLELGGGNDRVRISGRLPATVVVDCGTGRDVVQADRTEAVTRGCERR
jgi:hypothetical protein